MARASGSSVENTFLKGLITEATGMNFPENAVTESDNVVFDKTGLVHRRLGIDIEEGGSIKDLTSQGVITITGAIKTYLWKTAQVGSNVLLVIQVGSRIVFFDVSNASISPKLKSFSINLKDYTNADSIIGNYECSFSSGGGFLFIANQYLHPVVVEYVNTSTIRVTAIPIQIRDLDGYGLDKDNLGVTVRPTTLTRFHKYNLLNQGWYFDGKAAA